MENMTTQQAQNILATFPADDEHHTVQHSRDVLYVGQQIAGKHLTQPLECALLLHDVGHFFEDDKKNPIGHARLARIFLEEQGICVPEILLPVSCHEANEHLEKVCCKDVLFQKQNQKLKREILWNCRIVCEADIISHMREILKETHLDDEYCSKHFLDLLESEQLPTPDAVVYPNDRILYLLCGLSLIRLKESAAYLEKEKLVQHLVSHISSRCRTHISEIIRVKYGL